MHLTVTAMADKVTTMVIMVDLQCPRCYRKIKKVLCQYPQIRDQIYDEKNNTVTITVVGSNPEQIKQKIRYKGGRSIKGIDIKEPPKPKPKEPEKPKAAPSEQKPSKPKEAEKTEAKDAEKKSEKPASDPKTVDQPKPQPVPVLVQYPLAPPGYPWGYSGGPSFHGHGMLPPPHYEEYGRPVYDSWGGGGGYRGNYGSRYDYFGEENPSACTIM